MLIQEDHVDLQTSVGIMRTFIFRPAAAGSFPGIVLFGEIYQMTGPIARTARMLAGHGYIVAVPETYHDFEPPGSPFEYNAERFFSTCGFLSLFTNTSSITLGEG